MEGIQVILIGLACAHDKPLVIVGGNRKILCNRVSIDFTVFKQLLVVYILEYIRAYDIEGNEKLWIVTSGNINSLALIDANNDGKNEVFRQNSNQFKINNKLSNINFFFVDRLRL